MQEVLTLEEEQQSQEAAEEKGESMYHSTFILSMYVFQMI